LEKTQTLATIEETAQTLIYTVKVVASNAWDDYDQQGGDYSHNEKRKRSG
jgi:hypothetical protein